jgi:acetyl esterase/lipase
VLLVDYSLAPEHPFPAGLEDVLKVYRSLLTTDFDKKRIFIGGDSAGGGLALSSMLALRSTHDPLPAAAILLSPWVDLMLRGETLASRELLDPLVSEAGLRLAAELYRGNHPLDDPLLSPIDADLEGLPPLLIHVGDHEILLSDSLRLAENARKAKVDVEMKLWPKLWHFFHAWDELPETKVSLHEIARFLQQNFIDK